MLQNRDFGGRTRTRVAKEPVDGKSTSSTRTLERGLAILDCYDVDHWGRTLTEICAETGLPKATAFRLLKTLEQRGYLTLDSLTNRYCLGPSMMKAGYLMASHSDLVRFARPFLDMLVGETSETAVLTTWSNECTVTLDYALTPLSFQTVRPCRPAPDRSAQRAHPGLLGVPAVAGTNSDHSEDCRDGNRRTADTARCTRTKTRQGETRGGGLRLGGADAGSLRHSRPGLRRSRRGESYSRHHRSYRTVQGGDR